MKTEATTVDESVNAYLSSLHVSFSVTLRGPTKKDKRDCDEWAVTFTRVGVKDAYSTPYFTGTGHRDKWGKPTAPAAATVLHSLILDASAADRTFDDWCAEYEYDTDSRKALDTFMACQDIGSRLVRLLGRHQVWTLTEMLQDY